MFDVTVTGRFTATHALRCHDGPQEPKHAHEWVVRVTVCGENLDEAGMLVDFGLLQRELARVLEPAAGSDLNNLPLLGGRPPSAENVALVVGQCLSGRLPAGVGLRWVEVEEAPGCAARYRPPGYRGPVTPC